MRHRIGSLLVSFLAVGALTFAVPAVAGAASHHHKAQHRHARRAAASKSTSSTSGGSETALTGSTLTSASNAALAAVPGTVSSATTETDGNGAYEVFVTKSDGTRVKVIEDASFNVLSTSSGSSRGGCH